MGYGKNITDGSTDFFDTAKTWVPNAVFLMINNNNNNNSNVLTYMVHLSQVK